MKFLVQEYCWNARTREDVWVQSMGVEAANAEDAARNYAKTQGIGAYCVNEWPNRSRRMGYRLVPCPEVVS